ncbi:MAG: TauD/TfdA family dioxygenase [Acidimicrobiia bacterium]
MTTSALATHLEVRPLTSFIGAEIRGVDLREPLADSAVAEIRAALLKWKVVFFRDQNITPEQQVEFGQRFGEITQAHPTLPGLEGHPKILSLDSNLFKEAAARIAAARGDKGAGTSLVGEYVDNRWHTDVTFVVNPPTASILRGVVVPPYGGDTFWTNLVAAYEHLSEPVRDAIDGLQAVHTNTLYTQSGTAGEELKKQFEATRYTSVHPVVRVHPETGERALFVNPGFTQNIVGVSAAESAALLRILFAQLSHPAFTVRFRWQPDSIAFWDNRATAHQGPGDLRHLEFERVVQRITLVGDVPVGPDGFTSESLQGAEFVGSPA